MEYGVRLTALAVIWGTVGGLTVVVG